MREIEPIIRKSNLLEEAGCAVFAFMLYPDDDQARNAYHVAAQLEKRINDASIAEERPFAVTKQHLRLWRTAVSNIDDLNDRYDLGLTAGVLLQSVIIQENLYREQPDASRHPPSIKKAKDTLVAYCRVARNNGIEASFNAKAASKAWACFKPVSHMWAGYVTSLNGMKKERILPLMDADELRSLLAYAREYFRRGQAIFPHSGTGTMKGKKSPVLDHSTFWFRDDDIFHQVDAEEYVAAHRKPGFEMMLKQYRYDRTL